MPMPFGEVSRTSDLFDVQVCDFGYCFSDDWFWSGLCGDSLLKL